VKRSGKVLAAALPSLPPTQMGCADGCSVADSGGVPFCVKLCSQDYSAYGSGEPVSCGPCVQNVQTCICATTTRSCDLAVCGNNVCSPGMVVVPTALSAQAFSGLASVFRGSEDWAHRSHLG